MQSLQLQRLAENVKLLLRDRFYETDLVQEIIAEVCGVNQSTISRWTTLESGIDPPIWLLVAIKDHPKLRGVGFGVLDYLESQYGRQAGQRLRVYSLDGSLHDEILTMIDRLGKLSRDVQRSPKEILEQRRDLERLKDVIAQAEAELNKMEAD